MTRHTTRSRTLPDVVHSDDDVIRHVDQLIGVACRRQLWLLFLDEFERPVRLVVPIAELEAVPDRRQVKRIAAFAREVAEIAGAAALILVWEREGRGRLDPVEQAAVTLMAEAFARPRKPSAPGGSSLRLRAQLLSSSAGVTVL